MNKKFILGIFVLSVVLTTAFVSAGLFSKLTPTGNVVNSDGWTDWLNRDGPGGSGDWETRTSFNLAEMGCENPTAIECETVDGKTIEETGENVVCELSKGLYCRNDANGGGNFWTGYGCSDYRIRFYCGEEKPVCGNGVVDSGEECDDGNLNSGDGCSSVCNEEKIIGNCTDSDGGKNYYVKGTITNRPWGNGTKDFTDICVKDNYGYVDETTENYLFEGYCGADGFGKVLNRDDKVYCPNGCSDGACIPENKTEEVTYQGVLDMLNSCEIVDGGLNGNQACATKDLSCVFSMTRMERIGTSGEYQTKLIDCSTNPDQLDLRSTDDFNTLCCSAP